MDFVVSADHRMKIKENKRRGMYLDFARDMKKLWKMKVTVIPIVIGALGMITNGLVRGLKELENGGQAKTIQTIALLRLARIRRRVLKTWRNLLSLRLQWKIISKLWYEKLTNEKDKILGLKTIKVWVVYF